MTETVTLPRRKRMRLQNFDYSQGGGYFITIDVLERRPLFGSVQNAAMQLNALGKLIEDAWKDLADHYQGLLVDEWIVMPDHLHGILLLTSTDNNVQLPSLIDVLHEFKSRTTRIYHHYKEENDLMEWLTKLWQRGYYERVVRSEEDLYEKRNYIRANPEQWELKRRGLL